MLGYGRDSFYRFKELYDKGGELALQAFRQRLVESGKLKLVVVVVVNVVARKLLTILKAVSRDDKPWRDVAKEHAHAKA